MSNSVWRRVVIAAAILAVLPSVAAAAGGGPVESVVIVADSRGMPAWKAWWTNLYNESHVLFAAATVAVVPILGAVLGVLANKAMSRVGINLSSRDLAEH
jgi:hypothetical protein